MSIGIYKFTNKINGKIYIGQSIHIEKRFQEHCQQAKHSPKTIFHTALQKYGIENFLFEIIELCEDSQLDDKEQYYINKYNSLTPNGYNIQLGGVDNHIVPEDGVILLQETLQDANNTQTLKEIAEEFGISVRSIYRINQGEVGYNKTLQYPLRPKPEHHSGGGYCTDCGIAISGGSTRCVDCMIKSQYTVTRPSKEQLAQEIAECGFEAVGRKYGVSGNAIKKWCVRYDLPKLKKEIQQWVKDNL